MVRVKKIRGRGRRSTLDFTRLRRNFQGQPTNYVDIGVVGHADQNPAFARVESGKVLVEVTLVPSGDEIIAELGLEGQGSDYGHYIPISIGARVVVVFPKGEEDAVIVARLTDDVFPFPEEVAGIDTTGPVIDPETGAAGAPHLAFLKTPDGTILAIESGEGGDLVIKSGGSIKIEASTALPIHLNGRVHLGADFTSQPSPQTTGASGEINPGTPATPFIPTPLTPAPGNPIPTPPTPATVPAADSIVRAKDAIQSDITSDPIFWTFINGLYAHPLIGPVLASSGIVLPLVANSSARAASRHTASD